jgi:hypothetical protein
LPSTFTPESGLGGFGSKWRRLIETARDAIRQILLICPPVGVVVGVEIIASVSEIASTAVVTVAEM